MSCSLHRSQEHAQMHKQTADCIFMWLKPQENGYRRYRSISKPLGTWDFVRCPIYQYLGCFKYFLTHSQTSLGSTSGRHESVQIVDNPLCLLDGLHDNEAGCSIPSHLLVRNGLFHQDRQNQEREDWNPHSRTNTMIMNVCIMKDTWLLLGGTGIAGLRIRLTRWYRKHRRLFDLRKKKQASTTRVLDETKKYA